MSKLYYVFYQCVNPDCGLRFPSRLGDLFPETCPRCKGHVDRVADLDIFHEAREQAAFPRHPQIGGLLDNIRSAWNVGSIFRTADGMGVQKLYLCGITPTPANPSVCKTALGAEKVVAWDYYRNAIALASSLDTHEQRLWVLEDTKNAVCLYDLSVSDDNRPIILAVGNEVCGVDPGLVELAERVVSIPMTGTKRSYNVAVAFGIAVSYLRYSHNFSHGSDRKFPNTS